MKRLAWLLALIIICIGWNFAHAADTVTTKKGAEWQIGDITKREVIITWLDDGGDGISESINMSKSGLNIEGWLLYSCTTDPGATQPTDNYDITWLDKYGVDKLYGAGANRDEANSEDLFPTSGYPVVNGPGWTFTVAGNSVSNATAIMACIFFSN